MDKYFIFINLDEWALSFSLIKNSTTLFSLNCDPNDIRVAHAIRCFNALMLLLSHKCMAIFYVPYSNRTAMIEMFGRPWTVLARAASLYTDPFLMLSGMLTAYSLYGKLQKTGRLNILKEYFARYLRIMPPLAFLIILCTFILPLIGNGPQWNLVVTHHAGICKEYWWRNLLFIHNWFGFKNMWWVLWELKSILKWINFFKFNSHTSRWNWHRIILDCPILYFRSL